MRKKSIGVFHFPPGDIVKVRSAREILSTLDDSATLDSLPFMPEMLAFCGRRFRISRRIAQTCINEGSGTCSFADNDVVLLEDLRCDGSGHGGCSKMCTILWKEAWLEKAQGISPLAVAELPLYESQHLFNTAYSEQSFVCQATDLPKATQKISLPGKFRVFFQEMRAGTFGPADMVKLILFPVAFKVTMRLKAKFFHKTQSGRYPTPDLALNLQPGDLVEVKSLREITQTLDHQGKNRGLAFTALMRPFCRKRFRVLKRVDKIILETSGVIRELKNTVILEGVTCDGHTRIGGCPRNLYHFWREIWLRRVDSKESSQP
jgi:hypothetical protein